jgi:hypothetical protein
MSTEKTKEEYVVEFIKAFKAVEDEMEPYKEHRRDLKKNYVENGWISKDEMRFAVKAYRMMKSGDDFGQFSDIFEKLSKSFGGTP